LLGDLGELLAGSQARLVIAELRDELAHAVDLLGVRLNQVRKLSDALCLQLAQHLLEPEGLRRIVHAGREVRHAPGYERGA
jgi:hypothetical protein